MPNPTHALCNTHRAEPKKARAAFRKLTFVAIHWRGIGAFGTVKAARSAGAIDNHEAALVAAAAVEPGYSHDSQCHKHRAQSTKTAFESTRVRGSPVIFHTTKIAT